MSGVRLEVNVHRNRRSIGGAEHHQVQRRCGLECAI
jgi:hypothetical protein